MTGFFQMRGGISVLADGHGELELIAPYLVRIEAGLGSQYAIERGQPTAPARPEEMLKSLASPSVEPMSQKGTRILTSARRASRGAGV